MSLNPKLIIFDCDGVLVDSEPIANKVLAKLLSEIGIPTTYEQSLGIFLGKSWKDSLIVINELLGKKPPPDLYEIYMDRMFKEFEDHLRPIQGIEQVLQSINANYCVASSGPHQKIRKTLGVTGLLPLFEGKIFSSTDVGKGKPEPDLFLHACSMMGYTPQQTIVIEDSLAGIQAARSAGMRVFVYRPSSNEKYQKDNNEVITFRSMNTLSELIDKA
ncbi:MAG: HAD family hydrolase [Chloroflexi bacterium]|nr:HAD family hydrolase [Chloroflexota bacterium]MQG00621.1 HAD family hydrolase [SAR202 cluster bacterium]